MSRKHFRALADAIREISHPEDRKRVAELIAAVCAAQNPRFKSTLFYAACGVNS